MTRRADLALWVTMLLLLAVVVLSVAAVVWRLVGHGPLFPLGEPHDPFTPATVAPAVPYQEEP